MTTATANANIALVKYWGKRSSMDLNLPAAPSFSLTLEGLKTTTTISSADNDSVDLNDAAASQKDTERLLGFVDRFRAIAGDQRRVRITSNNNFPTAAGLASSASGFAALTVALDAFFELGQPKHELSRLARMGSGSAARSIFGGFVQMNDGDDHDAFAEQVFDQHHWDLSCVVAVTAEGEKKIGSTVGMVTTQETSPYFQAWTETVRRHMPLAIDAVRQRDFTALADVAEHSCLAMHASAIAANPGVLYWNPTTVALIHLVRELRSKGTPVFFSIDAGPHVKVFCPSEAKESVAATLAKVPGVLRTLSASPGAGASVE